MKITLRTPRPRNPLVPLARARKAGRHGPGTGGQRQQAKSALRRELERPRP